MDRTADEPLILITEDGAVGTEAENLAVVAERMLRILAQHLALEILFQVFVVDAGPDKPVERRKIFDESDLGQRFSAKPGLIRL